MSRPILLFPDPRLKKACAPIGRITSEIETLAADMLAAMYAAPGVGLAAPQVGVLLRLFVMDCTKDPDAPPAPPFAPSSAICTNSAFSDAPSSKLVRSMSSMTGRPSSSTILKTSFSGCQSDARSPKQWLLSKVTVTSSAPFAGWPSVVTTSFSAQPSCPPMIGS